MTQAVRVAALGASLFGWLVLTVVALPLIEGGGSSPVAQLAVTSLFAVWLVWAAVAIRYDRRESRERTEHYSDRRDHR